MKKYTLTVILAFLVVCFTTANADNKFIKPILNIALVHSYHLNHPCTGPQHFGITQNLRKLYPDYKIVIRSYQMKSKTINKNRIERVSKIIKNKIEDFKPNYIFTTDDNAFEYVAIPLSKNYKIISSGLNKPYEGYKKKYPKLNENNLIIIEELIRMDNIFNILELAKIKIGTWHVLYDNTPTSYYMMKNYESELSGKGKVVYTKVETIDELRSYLRKNKKKYDVYVITLQSIYDRDRGEYVTKEKFFKEFKFFNHKMLELGGNPIFSKFGISICCGPDFYMMGNLASEHFINEVIKNKNWKHLKMTPIMSVSVNIRRLRDLGYSSLSSGGFKIINDVYENY